MNEQLEAMARQLELSNEYRVLRRLRRQERYSQTACEHPLRAIVIDAETTALDVRSAEVIELAMRKFEYSPDGDILRIVGDFDQLQQPTTPITAEVKRLTGITDEMVAGHAIDPAAVAAFVADVALIIAHNARYDRPICEKVWPVFKTLNWACSLDQIPWRDNGHDAAALGCLLKDCGYFYNAHRAGDDCLALLQVLASPFGPGGAPGLATLLKNARETTILISAVDAPYNFKDLLKSRGYRWSDGSNGSRRCWWRDVPQRDFDVELAFLRAAVFNGRPVNLPTMKITAKERYSSTISL